MTIRSLTCSSTCPPPQTTVHLHCSDLPAGAMGGASTLARGPAGPAPKMLVDGVPQLGGQDVVRELLFRPAPARLSHTAGEIRVTQDGRQSFGHICHPGPFVAVPSGLVVFVRPALDDQTGLPVFHCLCRPTAFDRHARDARRRPPR